MQHITLAASCWNTSTYRALTCVGRLQLLAIKIEFLGSDHATAVSGLHSSVTVQIVFKNIHRLMLFGLPFFPNFLSCIQV